MELLISDEGAPIILNLSKVRSSGRAKKFIHVLVETPRSPGNRLVPAKPVHPPERDGQAQGYFLSRTEPSLSRAPATHLLSCVHALASLTFAQQTLSLSRQHHLRKVRSVTGFPILTLLNPVSSAHFALS